MPDLLIRNVPADVIEGYASKARDNGTALEDYVSDVLQGKQPVTRSPGANTEALVALTQRNMARFRQPLRPLARHEMREGMEE